MWMKGLLRRQNFETLYFFYTAQLSLDEDLDSGLGSGSGDWDEQDGDCELTCAGRQVRKKYLATAALLLQEVLL